MGGPLSGILSIVGHNVTISFKYPDEQNRRKFNGKLSAKAEKDFQDINVTVVETAQKAAKGHTAFTVTVGPSSIEVALNDDEVEVSSAAFVTDAQYEHSGEGDWNVK